MVCILNAGRVAWAFGLSICSTAQAKRYPTILEMIVRPAAKINDVASSDLGQGRADEEEAVSSYARCWNA